MKKPQPKPLKSLCLFFASGRTFTFRNVTILSDNENAINFTYTAMSDGEVKEGNFSRFHVVGISKTR